MTIIVKDPLQATSTLCTTSSVYDSVDDSDLTSTAVSGLAATLSTQMASPMVVYVDAASRYIDSLSTEQLYEMEKRLAAKEQELLVENVQIDKPKVLEKKVL